MSLPPFMSSLTPPSEQVASAYWFVFAGSHLLVCEGSGGTAVPRASSLYDISPALSKAAIRSLYLGYLDGDEPIPCYGVEVLRDTAVPLRMGFYNLRQLYTRIPDELLTLAGRALQIVDWDRTHQFCSRCGSTVEDGETEHVKRCASCELTMYPRLAPAIIVRVQRKTKRGAQILLARGPHYPPGWFSVLAGFVEPGETLEACVAREVYEEVGIRITNIKYFGSQPWPFPHSLMIGFTADYESGALKLQADEIEEARWFYKDELPKIPPRMSISRHLIDDFVTQAM